MAAARESFQSDLYGINETGAPQSTGLSLGIADFPPLKSSHGFIGGNSQNPRSGLQTVEESGAGTAVWSSVVMNNKRNEANPIAYQAPVMIEGNQAVSISSEILKDKIKACEEMAIGYCVGRKPSFSMVKEAISKVWKTKSEVSISLHSSNSFVFKFMNPEDRTLALEHGVFYIGSILFVVRAWSPFIENSIAEMKSIPVWMLFYKVPLHLWNNLGLGPIASFVGKPLMMDDHTINQTRLSYARVLVEINIDCKFPTLIPLWMDGKFVMNIPVDYEWKPQKCDLCCSFGHSSIKCPSKKDKRKPHWTPKKKNIAKVLEMNQQLVNVGTSDKEKGGNELSEMVSSPVSIEEQPRLVEVLKASEGDVESAVAISVPLDLPSAEEVQVQERRSDTQSNDFLWTYAKRNKKVGKKNSPPKTVATSHLNPFDVLSHDGELQEQGLLRVSSPNVQGENSASRNSSATKEAAEACSQDSRDSRDALHGSVEQEVQLVSNEEAMEEAEINTPKETVEACEESSEDDIDAGNMKSVEEVSKYKPKTTQQHMDGILKFSSFLNLGRGGKEEEVKNIFTDIVGSSNQTKDLGPSSEDLGRGKRTPMPKKIY